MQTDIRKVYWANQLVFVNGKLNLGLLLSLKLINRFIKWTHYHLRFLHKYSLQLTHTIQYTSLSAFNVHPFGIKTDHNFQIPLFHRLDQFWWCCSQTLWKFVKLIVLHGSDTNGIDFIGNNILQSLEWKTHTTAESIDGMVCVRNTSFIWKDYYFRLDRKHWDHKENLWIFWIGKPRRPSLKFVKEISWKLGGIWLTQ